VPKKDSIEAYAWFIVAASSTNEPEGSQEAIALRRTRDAFEQVLTRESKSQAQARAAMLRKLIEEHNKGPGR
jgi:hypothetical protein